MVSNDGELRKAVAAPVAEYNELAGLADALAQLTPNQRRAILLREWQGLSYREIAKELETSEAAIETLLFRARRSLARKLDRSRSRVWGGLNVGSLVAYGKSLLGGAALKIAATTVVVAAGATLASLHHHHVARGGSQVPEPALTSAPASLQAPAVKALPSRTRSRAASGKAERAPVKATGRTATPRRGAVPAPAASGTHTEAGSAPAPAQVPAGGPGPVPVTVPPPVQVEVPPLPPLLVEVPPVPPVLPVTLPQLPSVPPVPGLPKLP